MPVRTFINLSYVLYHFIGFLGILLRTSVQRLWSGLTTRMGRVAHRIRLLQHAPVSLWEVPVARIRGGVNGGGWRGGGRGTRASGANR